MPSKPTAIAWFLSALLFAPAEARPAPSHGSNPAEPTASSAASQASQGCEIVTQEAKLTASDPEAGAWFGNSVAIDGDTAVIGASTSPDSVYVFARTGTGWIEQNKLEQRGGFGNSVAVSGATILVGAPFAYPSGVSNAGSAYVYVNDEQAGLTAGDPGASDHFGWSVAVSGDIAVIGAPDDDHAGGTDAGSAYVFVRNGALWTQQAKLIASDAGPQDEFGYSVALCGETALIGAYLDGHSGWANAGSAYVFVRDGTSWTEQAKLTASDSLEEVAEFGYAVAVSGDTAVVGALKDSTALFNAGSAYVFVRNGNAWGEQAKLTASDPDLTEYFGASVAVSGDTAVIGASRNNGIYFVGDSAYVFARAGTTWIELASIAEDGDPHSNTYTGIGISVALAGDTALLGAKFLGLAPLESSGAAFVYRTCLSPVSYCTAGSSGSGCQAALSASGIPSASAPSGFDLLASTVEGAKDGMFFYGTQGQQATPWGNGTSFQCVAPPVKRLGSLAGNGTAGVCDGAFFQDLNATWCPTCPKPGLNPGAGAQVQAQLWYRDPLSTSNQTTSLSDALEFCVVP